MPRRKTPKVESPNWTFPVNRSKVRQTKPGSFVNIDGDFRFGPTKRKKDTTFNKDGNWTFGVQKSKPRKRKSTKSTTKWTF